MINKGKKDPTVTPGNLVMCGNIQELFAGYNQAITNNFQVNWVTKSKEQLERI